MIGGAEGDRTPDLRIANATLSRLSYGPDLIYPCHTWVSRCATKGAHPLATLHRKSAGPIGDGYVKKSLLKGKILAFLPGQARINFLPD